MRSIACFAVVLACVAVSATAFPLGTSLQDPASAPPGCCLPHGFTQEQVRLAHGTNASPFPGTTFSTFAMDFSLQAALMETTNFNHTESYQFYFRGFSDNIIAVYMPSQNYCTNVTLPANFFDQHNYCTGSLGRYSNYYGTVSWGGMTVDSWADTQGYTIAQQALTCAPVGAGSPVDVTLLANYNPHMPDPSIFDIPSACIKSNLRRMSLAEAEATTGMKLDAESVSRMVMGASL